MVEAPGQLSEPVGVIKFTIAPHIPDGVPVVMGDGQLIVGGAESPTVTVTAVRDAEAHPAAV